MKRLTFLEIMVYYIVNICMLGIPFLVKIIIKKAIIEAK
jgi:hypothetical protein